MLRSVLNRHFRIKNRTIAFFSTAPHKALQVLFGSQTGTAQLFATELGDQASALGLQVEVSPLNLKPPPDVLKQDAIWVFVLACYGVGQPTDNAKKFMEWLHSDQARDVVKHHKYTVFGLGNSRTHTQNYNLVGKLADARLAELGAQRLYPLGLGDDSDCIDDDFDAWSKSFLEALQSDFIENENHSTESCELQSTESNKSQFTQSGKSQSTQSDIIEKPKILQQPPEMFSKSATCLVESQDLLKHSPQVILSKEPKDYNNPRQVLQQESFYLEGTNFHKVTYNHRLAPSREGMLEMALEIDAPYVTGDHLWIYPENHPALCDAYAKAVGADPHDVIEKVESTRRYPYPLGLTVLDTLQYCVELNAVPSPSLARSLGWSGDYKSEIAEPRVTVLQMLSKTKHVTLGELLMHLPPMQPRYYSISSSPLRHPNQVLLSYRPVQYWTSQGHLRLGTCTSYMTSSPALLAAGIRSNPSFRLPSDSSTPLLLIAGGCGIAPIRAILEERMATMGTTLGPAYLFFGVRSLEDLIYKDFIQDAKETGALTEFLISYSNVCRLEARFVSDDLERQGKLVYEILEQGGHIYLCGGAGGFAPSCAMAVKKALEKHGNLTPEQAQEYYMTLVREGRYSEDISS